jgi:ribonuclease-3
LDNATAWLKKSLAYEFVNEDLLRRALTHRSAAGSNNERLEFLGDSVLQLIVSERVFGERPRASEGRLSRLRSLLVRDKTLSDIATELGLGEHLILGSGERKTGGHRRASILADAIEAIFGAVYLDAGFEAARLVVERAYGERLQNLPEGKELRDPKSRLQELLQAEQKGLPVYAVENVSGKAHKQYFEVSCTISDPSLQSTGGATTRRDAEQEAASEMLEMLESDRER